MSARRVPIVAIAEVTFVVDLFMVVSDMGPNLVLVTALCLVVGVGLWFIYDLMSVEPTRVATGPPPETPAPADRRVMRLRSGLMYVRRDDSSLDRLRASLVELVDDQLRAAHHIDRAEHPETARAVLGDELSAFVEDPRAARELASPRQLDRILTLIEQI